MGDVGIMVSGYLSSTQKKEDAQAKVQDARQELNTAQKDANAAAQIVATDEEWESFRNKSELKIKANEIRITRVFGYVNPELTDKVFSV